MGDRSWADFRLTTFGEPYMVWHDGADFGQLLVEWERDPDLVEAMLLDGLAQGDPLAAEAIRELPLDEAAAERLIDALRAAPWGAAMAVEVGQSLARLTGDEAHTEAVAAVLTSDEHWGDRLDAAMALARFTPTSSLISALERGLIDDEYLVRYHSANSLLAYGGVEQPDISTLDDDFAVVVSGEEAALLALRDRLGAAARARLE